jgi:geranylgeranyl transferase type-1 subunit beta
MAHVLKPDSELEATLNRTKHTTYWKRCLKTYLPAAYTSNDSSRLLLAFFIISALDLLGELNSSCTEEERQSYIDWIYLNQVPEGGFRGSPGLSLGKVRNADNQAWDPPTVPCTYFALVSLAVLGDNLERVNRKGILQWLTKIQRPDGSFGETLGANGQIEGGTDTRFMFCAMAIRWVLRGDMKGTVDNISDIDVDSLVNYIRASEVTNHLVDARENLLTQYRISMVEYQELHFMNRMASN